MPVRAGMVDDVAAITLAAFESSGRTYHSKTTQDQSAIPRVELECIGRREIALAQLLKAFDGKATLGEIGARFRCHRRGMRGARIESDFVGPTNEG